MTIVSNFTEAQGRNAATIGIEPASILGMVYEGRPLLLPTHQPITGEFQSSTGVSPIIEIAIENGNSATRAMALHVRTHRAVITETASVYEEQTQNTIYSIDDHGEEWQREKDGALSAPFRIGEYASHLDLPIGATNIRWQDPRFVAFNQAVIVSTLRAAGYGPGTHMICVLPGARNEEVSVETGPDPDVTAALKKGLQSFVLWRNRTKEEERYDIRIVEVVPPVPQTFGSHYAFDTDIVGRSLHPNLPEVNWFDIGFYDAHIVDVRRSGKRLTVNGVKVADGMSQMVRGLGAYLRKPGNFSKMSPPTYAQSLEMMRTGEVKIGGMPLPDAERAAYGKKIIREYIHTQASDLISTMLAQRPNINSLFGFTGGGVIDVRSQIQEKTAHRPENLTLILAPEISRVANVIGIYWLLNLAKRKQSILRAF